MLSIQDTGYDPVRVYEESAFFKFRYPLYEDAERVFLRVIASQDDLTYYHWEYVDDESHYLDYIPLFYRRGAREMVRVTQGILGLKRERLMEYFRDCPDDSFHLLREQSGPHAPRAGPA